MEIREDLYDFVLNRLVEEGNTKEESLLMMSTINENWVQGMQNAAKMFRMMTGIDKMPVKPPSGPANLTNIFRGASTPRAPKPAPFQIGTPPKAPPAPPSPMGIRGAVTKGGVHGAVASAVLNAKNTADGTLDAARRRGDLDKKPGPDQGVGVKPRVAGPYIPERPKATETPKTPEKKPEPEVKPVAARVKKVDPPVKQPEKPKVDPEVQRYRQLIKQGKRLEAEKLGREIYQRTYSAPAFRPTKTA